MILEIAFFIIGAVLSVTSLFLPGGDTVPLHLPWGIDEIFSTGINGYKILAVSYPPFTVVLQAFLIYIGFRIVLRLLKAVPVLGHTLS